MTQCCRIRTRDPDARRRRAAGGPPEAGFARHTAPMLRRWCVELSTGYDYRLCPTTLCDLVTGRNRKNVPVSWVSLAACWGPSGSPWGLQGPGPPCPRPRPADPHPAGRRILLNCVRGVTHQVSEPKGKSCRSRPSQVPPGRCRKLPRRKKSSRCFFGEFFLPEENARECLLKHGSSAPIIRSRL